MSKMDETALYYISLVAALLFLLGLSTFFSLSETSFSSLSRIKIKNMAGKNSRTRKAARARLVLQLLDSYDKLLSSVLIGNTIANVVSSALAAMLFIGLFGSKGVTIASVVVTALVLIFGEISPKTLAKESPELTALRAAPLLRFFTIIFAPFNYLASVWKKIIIKIFAVNTDRSVTEDELLTFVEEVRQEGGINKHEEQMIRHAIEFDDLTAAEIMTPRMDLAAVSQSDTAGRIETLFEDTGFSRLPVYRDNIDNITGIMLFKDFNREVIKKGKSPLEIIKPAVLVTKTIKISKLLRVLQEKQSHMAVLVDEFGGTLGIVTVEDILEELVGEIWDEHDRVVEPITHNADGSFSALGSLQFQDMVNFIVNKTPNSDLTEGGEIPSTTVGNWVMEAKGESQDQPGQQSGGGPLRAGEQFDWHRLRIRVSRVQRSRVMEVIVTEIKA
ncbi:MAG: hemolysin family protein [Treponema sp.]|jgi:CBS domain containing-hemolysin-like protein|nr:hemolysin family protein [Treponema sp.]